MIKKQQNVIKDQQGVALLVVVLILLVFTILFSGAIFSADNNLQQAVKVERYTETYYSAESGINVIIELINKNAPKKDSGLPAFKTTVMTGLNVSNSSLSVVLKDVATPGEYLVTVGGATSDIKIVELPITETLNPGEQKIRYSITSTGKNLEETRTLSTEITLLYKKTQFAITIDFPIMINDYAADGTPGYVDAYGVSLLTNTTNPVPMCFDANKKPAAATASCPAVKAVDINGNFIPILDAMGNQILDASGNPVYELLYLKKPPTNVQVQPVDGEAYEPVYLSDYKALNGSFELPGLKLPDYSTKLTDSTPVLPGGNLDFRSTPGPHIYQTSQFQLPSSIILGDDDVEIFVKDKLEFFRSTTVKGNGRLIIHCMENCFIYNPTNNITVGGLNATGTPPDAEIILYVYGKENVRTIGKSSSGKDSNSNILNMNVMGLNVNLDLKNGGQLNGNFLSEYGSLIDFKNNSGSTSYLYYAPNSKYQLKNNGEFTGVLIVDSVKVEGTFKIYYDAAVMTTLPDVFTEADFITSTYSGEGELKPIIQNPIVEQ